MKTKAFKKHRARVQALMARWVPLVGLGHWTVECRYYDDEAEFQKVDGTHAVFRTWARWQYLWCVIAVNVPGVKRLDDDELEYFVVHELCHGAINELREADADGKHEERVVTMLAKAFIWTRNAARAESVEETT